MPHECKTPPVLFADIQVLAHKTDMRSGVQTAFCVSDQPFVLRGDQLIFPSVVCLCERTVGACRQYDSYLELSVVA